MPSEAYYAVASGHNPGVYMSWEECKAEVTGFSGASYKKFSTQEEADAFVKENATPVLDKEVAALPESRVKARNDVPLEPYYAVASGRNVGVYRSWEECKTQVIGFSGAFYKKFSTQEEADAFVKENATTVKSDGYYAVASGRNPGVYMSWEECKTQVLGFSGASYKKFSSQEEADAFVKENATTVKSNGYYAVASGRNPGVYRSWEECKAEVIGFGGACFKKCRTHTEADAFVKENVISCRT